MSKIKNFFKYLFLHGTKLAILQDNFIELLNSNKSSDFLYDVFGESCLKNDFFNIETLDKEYQNYIKYFNLWCFISRFLAPNNLSIRHYSLKFIFSKSDREFNNFFDIIIKEINKISIQNEIDLCNGEKRFIRLWAEGYTYWLYVDSVLELVDGFSDKIYNRVSDKFKKNIFNKASILNLYRRDIHVSFWLMSFKTDSGLIYPPLYGSVRDHGLSEKTLSFTVNPDGQQIKRFEDRPRCLPVSHRMVTQFSRGLYLNKKFILGGNTHTVSKNHYIDLKNKNYKIDFYEGYYDKFPDFISEWSDIIKRLLSWPFQKI